MQGVALLDVCLVGENPIEQRLGERRVRGGTLGLKLHGHVEVHLGLVVTPEQGKSIDQMDVRIDVARREFKALLKPRDRLFGAIELNERRAENHRRLRIAVFGEIETATERLDRVFKPTRGFERQTKIELPFGLVRIDSDRHPQRGFGFVPAPRFVELVGAFDLLFGFMPIVHLDTVALRAVHSPNTPVQSAKCQNRAGMRRIVSTRRSRSPED